MVTSTPRLALVTPTQNMADSETVTPHVFRAVVRASETSPVDAVRVTVFPPPTVTRVAVLNCRTAWTRALLAGWALALVAAAVFPTNLPGRPGDTSSTIHLIAGAAVFLASPAGAYMNGQSLVIDGGRVAGAPTEQR